LTQSSNNYRGNTALSGHAQVKENFLMTTNVRRSLLLHILQESAARR
jgi:hypothetical protein